MMTSQSSVAEDDLRIHNAHSERIIDQQNAAGFREDTTQGMSSDKVVGSFDEVNLLKEEIKNLKTENAMEKLRFENENLKKDGEIKDFKMKFENEIKELRNENEMLKLRSENAVLKAEKQFGIENAVLVAEKNQIGSRFESLKAENEKLKENKGEEIEKALEVERKKFEVDLLKSQEEKSKIEKNYDILETEKLKIEKELVNLGAENERIKNELEVMKNKIKENNTAPRFLNIGDIELAKLTLEVIEKEEPYLHYEKLYRTLNFILTCSGDNVTIFKYSQSMKCTGSTIVIDLKEEMSTKWQDAKSGRILHPFDNIRYIPLFKANEQGYWTFTNDNNYGVTCADFNWMPRQDFMG